MFPTLTKPSLTASWLFNELDVWYSNKWSEPAARKQLLFRLNNEIPEFTFDFIGNDGDNLFVSLRYGLGCATGGRIYKKYPFHSIQSFRASLDAFFKLNKRVGAYNQIEIDNNTLILKR